VIAGLKRGLNNLNPFNWVQPVSQPMPGISVGQTQELAAKAQAGDASAKAALTAAFSEMEQAAQQGGSTRAVVENLIPGSGMAMHFGETAMTDPAGALSEALVTFGAPYALYKGIGAIPTTKKAGAKFQQVQAKAKDIPLNLKKADDVALEAVEMGGRGGDPGTGYTLPKVFRDYMRRRERSPEMTYETGRKFASKAGDLSAAEKQAYEGAMQGKITQFSRALDESNRAAAESVGMGKVYDQAMKEYRQAMTIREKGAIVQKWAKRAAAATALGAAFDYARN
jgi:hypothetical protein